jgi:hypothetical protein
MRSSWTVGVDLNRSFDPHRGYNGRNRATVVFGLGLKGLMDQYPRWAKSDFEIAVAPY